MTEPPQPIDELRAAQRAYDLANVNNPQEVAKALERLRKAKLNYDFGNAV